ATPVKTELVTDDSFSDTLNHYEVQTTPNFSGEAYLIIGTRRIDTDAASRFYIKDVKLEEGVTSTAWSPSPNDSLERYSEIKTTAENISLTVSKKVGEDEIISKINQSAEKISIDADKVNISGSTINIGSNPAVTSLKKENTLNTVRGTNLIKNGDFWNGNGSRFFDTHVVSNAEVSGRITNPSFGRGWFRMQRS